MSSHAKPHGLVRALLLAVSSLAVVGVIFAIYIQYAQKPDGPRAGGSPVVIPPAAPPADTTSRPGRAPTMQIEGVDVPGGGRTRINLYGSEGVQARLELEVDSWEPVGASGREFRLENPTIRFRTPDGQLVNVAADRGLVEMTRRRSDDYDLARGRLAGDVVILVDRLNDAQRAELPPEQRHELTDDRRIRVELDDLSFDLEYARVESSGRIHVALAEVEVEGRRLLLRYDEAASRIEYLKIQEGKQITLRGFGGAFAVAFPGAAEPSATDGEQADATPIGEAPPDVKTTGADAGEVVPVEDDGVPLFVPEVPEKRRVRETVTYSATFEHEVVVTQFDGQAQTGLLSADRLSFLFDFGEAQRLGAFQRPTSQPSGAGSPDPAAAPRPGDGPSAVLNWKGPLVVDLMRDPGQVPHDVFGKRLHITATGREVHVADRQVSARGKKLIYHYETEQVWLYGDADSGFVLDLESGVRLTGRELSFDPRGETATVLGPGVLSDRRTAGAIRAPRWGSQDRRGDVSVTFARRMNLRLGTVSRESADPLTGQRVVRQHTYLQSAALLGHVVMAQNGDSIAADRVEIGFRPPTEAGSLADTMESLRAEGGVRMVQGEERITCRSIDVDMVRDANGRVVPSRAEAVGDVVAGQRRRTITATERMIVDLQSVKVEKPPFDLVRAKVAAVRRGLNVDDVDWDARRERYEREKRFALGLRRLQAFGGVTVNDPEQNLRIDARQLDCRFRDGRRIDQGVVSGWDTLPASVAFGDFGISGRKIEFDAGPQSAEVPGAGRLAFSSRKDLDGRTVGEPIPISVTWTDATEFRGADNTAVFTGAVHAVSRNSTFDCDELVLDFDEVPPEASVGRRTADPWDWWFLRPFRARPDKSDGFTLEAPKINKQLAYLSANGNVIGLTASYNRDTGALRTRARIAGPRLAVDFRRQTEAMTIDDAGTLLIEDYRLRAPDDPGGATKMSPFGAAGDDLPSQTFIAWEGNMSYYSGSRLAVFEKGVQLVYRSGSKMLLAEGVLHDAALGHLRESTGGRDARLLCQQLNVQFLKSRERGGAQAGGGLGGVSGNAVASFSARGGVYFEDAGVSVTCRTVTFDRERNLLQILGSRQQPAELIDQRGGRYHSIKGPTIYWERDTDRIEAPRSTIRVH